MTRESRADPNKGPGGGPPGPPGPPGPVPGPIENEGGFKRVSTQFATDVFVKAVLLYFLTGADLCRGCLIHWVDSAYNGSVFFAMELDISEDFTCK